LAIFRDDETIAAVGAPRVLARGHRGERADVSFVRGRARGSGDARGRDGSAHRDARPGVTWPHRFRPRGRARSKSEAHTGATRRARETKAKDMMSKNINLARDDDGERAISAG